MDMDKARTSYPGKIKTFDPDSQTSTVQIARERYVDNLVSLNNREESPILVSVPVHFPQGGGYQLTFPIAEGDNCLVMFAERGCSHWLNSDSMSIGTYASGFPKADFYRKYDVNDSFALVGFNSIPKAIPAFQPGSVELRNTARTQRVTLIPGGLMEVRTEDTVDVVAPTVNITGNVNITGDVTISGKLDVQGIIKSFTDVIAKVISLFGHTHTSSAPGNPTSAPLP